MLWKNQRESSNVEDRRGLHPGIALGGGATLVVIVVSLLFGADPQDILNQLGAGPAPGTTASAPGAPAEVPSDPHQDEQKHFVSVVLADTEDVWTAQFKALGRTYHDPTLVLFSGSVDSACGQAGAAVGPFYCPEDQKLYLDLSFLDELQTKLGAGGDFAQAYVIAHEVGHHVQHELGWMQPLDEARARGASQKQVNDLSVRTELQADFLAGVWAHYAQQTLGVVEPGDIEEALNAAQQIGDDKLEKEAQGCAVPDSFTHGTSAQRMRWFKRGYDTGDLKLGDTFHAKSL
jgi:predicted metalloprotease